MPKKKTGHIQTLLMMKTKKSYQYVLMAFTNESPLITDLIASSQRVNLTIRKVYELCDTTDRTTKM